MSQDKKRHPGSPAAIPRAPPLPAPKPLPLQQRARDAASRFLGFASRPPSPTAAESLEEERFTHNSIQSRSSSIGATQNATASHKTGLEIKTISINERGTHAIIAGKAIFKTVRVEDGHCTEDFNLRTAIRSTPTQASGQPRQIYEIDIADVAWAKGDTGDFVAAATSSGKIIVYDLGHAGLQAAQLHEHYRQVHNVTFNPHRGSLLLSGSQDGTVRLWDIRDCRSQASAVHSKRKYSGQSDGVRDVKWSPTEGYDFAFGTDHGDVQRWDMRNLKAAKVRIPAHGLSCNTVDWHPDGKHILSASSDKTVRVFDVSTNRPKKASWEIKTAYPVMLARWRPACQSIMPQDNGAQQCTQVVTAYDREHPMMHVWDFRRPLLPFRQLQPYQKEAPTDMLWHSQDLLWTVGREGIFLQTDIQHAPKLIDRSNLQAFDVSPVGELTLVAQQRKNRRRPTPQQISSLHSKSVSNSLGTSPESSVLSRSWADDSLDQSFLSVLPFKRQRRSNSGSRTHGAHASSNYNHNQSATIKLDDILFNRKSFRPQQVSCRGHLPSHNNPTALAFLAERYKMSASMPVPSYIDEAAVDEDMAFLSQVRKVFENNEDAADAIGFSVCAQTWKMVGHCVEQNLRERIGDKHHRIRAMPAQQTFEKRSSVETLARRYIIELSKSPRPSPAHTRPVSTIAQQLAMPESTSNVPTPLARPSALGKNKTSPNQNLPDPDKDETITLPPSLATQHAMTSDSLSDVQQAGQTVQRLTVSALEDLQKLQPPEGTAERNIALNRWSIHSKAPLSLDTYDNGMRIAPAKLEKHDSSESFGFLEDSAGSAASSFPASFDSKNGSPSVRIPAAHPSRLGTLAQPASYPTSFQEDHAVSAAQSMFFGGSGTLANSAVATPDQSGKTSVTTSDEDSTTRVSTDTTDFALPARVKQPPAQQLAMKLIAEDQNVAAYKINKPNQPIMIAQRPHLEDGNFIDDQGLDTIKHWDKHDSPADSVLEEDFFELDLEQNKPWRLIEMLEQLVDYYTVAYPYPQMIAALLLVVGPLLPPTQPLSIYEIQETISYYVDYYLNTLGWDAETLPAVMKQCYEQPMKAGLRPFQVESMLATYHEQLLAHQLHDEAAALRKQCWPAYPAVWEDFARGSNNVQHTGAERCPVCWERSPAALWTSCLLCGHGGHTACLRKWFGEEGEEGCVVEGCLCGCVVGETARNAPEPLVREDSLVAKESSAVEGVKKLRL